MALSDFQHWWNEEGSAMRHLEGHDHEEHANRISRIAWSNGEYVAERDNAFSLKDAELLEWIHDRMLIIRGESSNLDNRKAFTEIITKIESRPF